MVVNGRIDEVQARIMGTAILAVEVLGPEEAFRRVVAEDELAGPIERRNGTLEFAYGGDAEAASELLARLVGAGVRVASFARRREGLEELFLKVGAKELS